MSKTDKLIQIRIEPTDYVGLVQFFVEGSLLFKTIKSSALLE